MDFTVAGLVFQRILAADGEALTYVDRDDGTPIEFTSVLLPGGEDGNAIVNVPTAAVAAMDFADKITDATGNVWRISEVEEIFGGIRKATLRKSTYWHDVSLQEYDTSTDAWKDHTTGLHALIEITSSAESLEPEDAGLVNMANIKIQKLSNIETQMRAKWGARIFQIEGILIDDTNTRWMELQTVEVVQ